MYCTVISLLSPVYSSLAAYWCRSQLVQDASSKFIDQAVLSYPYVSHIVNNAGTGSFVGIHIWKGLRELFRNPIRAVTAPNYKIENRGEISEDGLGWVWQCNVFGHYVIYKSILPLLYNSPFGTSRVLWMSSLEAVREFYQPLDWQLKETEFPYEGSKCQTDLLAATLDQHSMVSPSREGAASIRHIVVQPGVVNTDILGANQIGFLLNYLKLFTFYLVRLVLSAFFISNFLQFQARVLFSQNHTISPYTAAISAVYAVLHSDSEPSDGSETSTPTKYSSKTYWDGRAFVAKDEIDVWEDNHEAGVTLVGRMDALYDEFHLKSSAVS